MNYSSIEEIFSAGTTNMEVLRNNTKQDDGTDSIVGVSWFTYNGTVASTIYASDNSWIGFGPSSEHLKVNRRDAALYSLYREEGTLYDYYKFLKIRWEGYSTYNNTSASYAISYDMILWDTGDISLHMISIPSSNNNGIYSLVASSTYSYTVSSASPDVTFTKTESGFAVSNSIIKLNMPVKKRYLVRDNSTYYTVLNNALAEVAISELTSDSFLNYGVEDIPPISLLTNLTNPEILYWADDSNLGAIKNGLIITGVPPLPQILYYEIQDMSTHSSIRKAETIASDDAIFTITFDGGQTWQYYNNGAWNTATSESEGMTALTIKNLSESVWGEISTSTSYQFRCVLPSVDSYAHGIYVGYI